MQDGAQVPAAGRRKLGPWTCLALVVGNIIGAGVFLLPASLAPYGANSPWGWLLAIAGALCLAFVLARQAREQRGGPYAYVTSAFGQETGFAMMWGYWVSIWPAVSALAIAAVSYASSLVPALGEGTRPALLAIGLVWLFTIINAQGARAAGGVQLVTTLLKLVPLVVVALLALSLLASGTAPAPPVPAPVSFAGIAAVSAIATFAMLGFESATLTDGKVENEERVVPLATIAGTLIAGLATLTACAAVLFLLPGSTAATSASPFADAVAPTLGSGAGQILSLFAIVSALGALNGWIFCSGEVPQTMSEAGVFPRWIGKANAAGTPVRAQILSSLLVTLLLAANYSRGLSGLFTFMILVSTVSALVLYAAVAAAALKKGMTILPAIIGLAFALFVTWGSGLEATLWGVGLMLTGVPLLWLSRRASRAAAEAA